MYIYAKCKLNNSNIIASQIISNLAWFWIWIKILRVYNPNVVEKYIYVSKFITLRYYFYALLHFFILNKYLLFFAP
jgi:hypothetical protein